MLYDDGLAWVSDSFEDLKWKLEGLGRSTGMKRLKMNVQTKMMVSSEKARKVNEGMKLPLGVCRDVVGSNAILC